MSVAEPIGCPVRSSSAITRQPTSLFINNDIPALLITYRYVFVIQRERRLPAIIAKIPWRNPSGRFFSFVHRILHVSAFRARVATQTPQAANREGTPKGWRLARRREEKTRWLIERRFSSLTMKQTSV